MRPVTTAVTVAVSRHVSFPHRKWINRPFWLLAIAARVVTTWATPLPTPKVTVVATDEEGTYVVSPALVAVTRQVPAVDAESELPLTAQPVAVPFATA
jgi:hypothetical protein